MLYMDDGPNLFDPTTIYIKFDRGVDEAATGLMSDRTMRNTCCRIWNTPKHLREYIR